MQVYIINSTDNVVFNNTISNVKGGNGGCAYDGIGEMAEQVMEYILKIWRIAISRIM